MKHSFVAYKVFAHVLLRRVWLLYSALAFAMLVPLLRPGYILTLDMVFTPRLRMPTSSSNDYVFRVFLHVLNGALASDVIEKLLLFIILLLSGVGLHRLVQYLQRTDLSVHQSIGAYVGGILYTVNPFTYDRFMAGQYQVLLGYALLPWFTQLLLRFLSEPGWGSMLLLVACAVMVSIVSIHSIGLMMVLGVVALGVVVWQRRSDIEWRAKLWKFSLLALIMWLLASSYWLVPLLLGKGSVATQISGITTADQSAFATVGGNVIGKIGNIVRLQGFWVEAYDMYVLPGAHVPAWGLVTLIIWALVIAGGVSLWRSRNRAVVMVFTLSIFVALLLAIGILSGWLATHIPLLAGYREPEKFVALIALAYAVFTAYGVTAAIAYCRAQGGRLFGVGAIVLLLVVPFVWTPTMLRGFSGQLRPVQYPADWFAANALLKQDYGNYQTLFLPWHLYMRFNFTDRIIANPATAFFDKSVIVSDNPEFRGAALSNPTAAKRTIDQLLPKAEHEHDLGVQLAKLHVKYIIVSHSDDYRQYEYLAQRSDMQLVTKHATLDVYRNKAYRGE